MYYVEYLRASRPFVIATLVIAASLAVNLIIWRAGGVQIDKDFSIPLAVVWAVAAFVASIFASILACSLAAENNGHLPVAWTKPVPRTLHAAAIMAIDLAASVAVFFVTTGAVFAYFAVTGLAHHVTVPGDTWFQLMSFFLAPFGVYGLMQATTASLGRNAGAAIGFAWFGLIGLVALEISPLPPLYHSIVAFLNLANPLIYISVDVDAHGAVMTYGSTASILGIVLIGVFGAAAAIYQWQRVEA